MDLHIKDVVELKKTHPCGSKQWEITRVGMDIKLKCLGCGHELMLPRSKVEKSIKKFSPPAGKLKEEPRNDSEADPYHCPDSGGRIGLWFGGYRYQRAADGIKRLICPADGFLVRRAFFRPFFGTARLIISL